MAGLAGEKFKGVHRHGRFPIPAGAVVFPAFQGFDDGKFLCPPLRDPGRLEQQLAPVFGGHLAPGPFVEGFAGGADGLFAILLGAPVDLGEGLIVGGIDHIHHVALFRGDIL